MRADICRRTFKSFDVIYRFSRLHRQQAVSFQAWRMSSVWQGCNLAFVCQAYLKAAVVTYTASYHDSRSTSIALYLAALRYSIRMLYRV